MAKKASFQPKRARGKTKSGSGVKKTARKDVLKEFEALLGLDPGSLR
jgi:hypothetical protein